MSADLTKAPVFLGLQMTATAVHLTAVTESGEILAEVTAPYASTRLANIKTIHEQDPMVWWNAVRMGLAQILGKLRDQIASASQLKALSVCGTPGDLVVLDRRREPNRAAILAADARAIDQIVSLNRTGQEHRQKFGLTFRPTDPLAKIAWIKDNEPDLYDNSIFCHQTDFIVTMLTGAPLMTEFSLGVLTGCDLATEAWPDWIDYEMHLGVRERLPVLKPLGTPVGTIAKQVSGQVGLPTTMAVVLGSTAETAGFLSSGAKKVGDCYIVLDDHISIHGISSVMAKHPQLQLSKLPGRRWYYSTHCVTGTEWIKAWFDRDATEAICAQAEAMIPTDYIAYPNVPGGETFPFTSSAAEGFITPATDNHAMQFAACLQGTAFFESLCYRKLCKILEIAPGSGDIYSGGPWSRYDFWMQCRADVTAKVNRRMQATNGVTFGAALIAASGTHFMGLEKAIGAMVHIDRTFNPDPEQHTRYSELFLSFREMMEQQGYV